MAEVNETIAVDAPPSRVWELVGEPGRIAEWLPALASSSVEGERRTCQLAGPDGGEISERILEHSDDERRYAYEILEGPMPLESYRSEISVQERDGGSEVVWRAQFEPAGDAPADELVGSISEIYRGGLESLREQLES